MDFVEFNEHNSVTVRLTEAETAFIFPSDAKDLVISFNDYLSDHGVAKRFALPHTLNDDLGNDVSFQLVQTTPAQRILGIDFGKASKTLLNFRLRGTTIEIDGNDASVQTQEMLSQLRDTLENALTDDERALVERPASGAPAKTFMQRVFG